MTPPRPLAHTALRPAGRRTLGGQSRALPEAVAAYLREHHVMTLATQGADGPWAAAVFYANEGARLFFLSAPTTRHARNLAQDARCAATIHDDVADWVQVKGVQLEGRVQRLEGEDARAAQRVYGARFAIVANPASAPLAIAQALAKVAWYRLTAERLHFIDNRRGFGQRQSVNLV